MSKSTERRERDRRMAAELRKATEQRDAAKGREPKPAPVVVPYTPPFVRGASVKTSGSHVHGIAIDTVGSGSITTWPIIKTGTSTSPGFGSTYTWPSVDTVSAQSAFRYARQLRDDLLEELGDELVVLEERIRILDGDDDLSVLEEMLDDVRRLIEDLELLVLDSHSPRSVCGTCREECGVSAPYTCISCGQFIHLCVACTRRHGELVCHGCKQRAQGRLRARQAETYINDEFDFPF